MWIMVVLVGMVLVLARAMSTEALCSANDAAELQADAIEQGAIQYVLAHVDSLGGSVPTDQDMLCEGVKVGQGAFWIIRPNFDDPRVQSYGLVDEASKLNLSTATEVLLAGLPGGMTPDIACSIVDWRSAAKTDPTQSPDGGIGAQSQYYLSLPDNQYECKNAPFETVEELLLVKDMTTDILYGSDTKRNGVLAAAGGAGATLGAVGTGGPSGATVPDCGIAPFVTVYSAEPNSGATSSLTGATLVSVNSLTNITNLINTQLGNAAISQQVSRYLAPPGGGRGGPGGGGGGGGAGGTYNSLLDFYAKTTSMTPQQFAQIAPLITARTGAVKGLINVSTASWEVLECLTNLTGAGALTDDDVASLVNQRVQDGIDANNIAWVTQVITDRTKLGAIGRYLTTSSYQFSADIVSVTANGRAYRRSRVVVDATVTPPRVIYRQNLTQLGWPLPEDVLTTLRAGKSIDDAVSAGRTQTLTLGQR
jgi:hypothetical protein